MYLAVCDVRMVGLPCTIAAKSVLTASSSSCIQPVLQLSQTIRNFWLNAGALFSCVTSSSLFSSIRPSG